MAIKSKTYLKTKFESNDKPTQQDFIDLFDSVVLKLDDSVATVPSVVGKTGKILSNDGISSSWEDVAVAAGGVSTVNNISPISGNITIPIPDVSDYGDVVTYDATDFELAIGTKKTAFNVDFGTTAGTVLEGNTVIPIAYSLPVATSSVLGGVKQGSNISIDVNGVISASASGGDVFGPSSAVDGNFVSFDTTTGKLIKDSMKKATDFEVANINIQSHVTASHAPADAEKNIQSDWNQTNNTIDDYIKNKPEYGSAGVINADSVITYAGTGLNFTAEACRVRIFDNSTFTGIPKEYNIIADTFTATDDTTNYLYVDYNAGTPIYKLTTNVNLINESNTIPINTILSSTGFLHLSQWDRIGDGLSNKIHRRLVKTQRYARESGLAISTPAEYIADGFFSVYSGVVWRGARPFELQDCFSDGTNNTSWFFYFQTAPDVWEHIPSAPDFNTTQYSLNGVLTNLQGTNSANAYFNINWFFRGVEDANHVYYIVSDKQYRDLPTAQAENRLPTIPYDITSHAMLVGRVICQKSNVTPAITDNPKYVEGAFDSQFSGTVINDHNSLSGLQGGVADDYVHLTTDEKTDIFNITADTREPTGYYLPPVTPTWGGANNRVLTFPGTDYIYFQGKRFSKTNYTFDANISGNGKFFFYWEPDGSGGIRVNFSTSSWGGDNSKVSIAIMYISSSSVDYGKEWHGIRMDADTHARLHNVDGVKIQSGGLSTTLTSSTITIASGNMWDEDLPINIPLQTSVGVSYWTGTNYDRTALQSIYYAFSGTTPQYNNAGTPTNLTASYFGLYWIVATHRQATPVVSLLHTAQYDTFSNARSAMYHTNIRDVINTNAGGAQELRPISCVICTNVGGVNLYLDKFDLRFTSNDMIQDVNPSSIVHFDDVLIHNMMGNVIGIEHSVKTALENIDALISEAVYYPVSHRLTSVNADAVLSGNVANLQTLNASIAGSIFVDETNNGSDTGFQYRVRINITGAVNNVQIAHFYDGAGHNIQIGIVSSNGTTINPLCYYGTGIGVLLTPSVWTNNTFPITAYTDYIQNDGVDFIEIAYNHTSAGTNAHNLYIDKIALIKSSSGGATNLNDLSDVNTTTVPPSTSGETLVYSTISGTFNNRKLVATEVNMTGVKLLGKSTTGIGAIEEITVSGATLSGGILSIAASGGASLKFW